MKNKIKIITNPPHPAGLKDYQLKQYLSALITALNSCWHSSQYSFAPYIPVDNNRQGQLRIIMISRCNEDYPEFEESIALWRGYPSEGKIGWDEFADGRLQGFMEGFAASYREEKK